MENLTAMNIQQALPVLKWIWSALVLCGAIANAATLRAAWGDYRFVRKSRPDEASHVQAWSSLRDQIAIFAFQVGALWVRCWALAWPDPRQAQFALNWATDATLLTLMQLLLAYNCILDGRDRRKIIRLLPPFRKI